MSSRHKRTADQAGLPDYNLKPREKKDESRDTPDETHHSLDGSERDSDVDFDEDEYYEDEFEEDIEDEDDDRGPTELEVENEELQVDHKPVQSKAFLVEDDEFIPWMSTIHLHCTLEEGTAGAGTKEIGRVFGRYVKRGYIRRTFWESMEEPCQELANIAFEVFDRYGRLQREFKDHIVRKGTGAWGDELDIGNLLIIEYMIVDREWRRKGLGRMMLDSIIKKSKSGGRNAAFILVLPGWLRRDVEADIAGKNLNRQEEKEAYNRAADGAAAFYRANGFRRIGSSSCLGFAIDPNHPAHSILVGDDFEPAYTEYNADDEEAAVKDRNNWFKCDGESEVLKLMQNNRPLHHAALTMPDAECVKFFEGYQGDSANWQTLDSKLNNVLHIAAAAMKPKSVQWLLEHCQAMGQARNIEGYTPLNHLKHCLEEMRTKLQRGAMTIVVADNFRGFPTNGIATLTAFQGMIPTAAEFQQLKYGCTCHQCAEGFLSPRMQLALCCQAEYNNDMLDMEIDDAENWLMYHEDAISHVATDIQKNFRTNKSLRQGFVALFGYTAAVLRAGKVPNVQNVLEEWRDNSEWPPVTQNFLKRGGRIQSVLMTIFESVSPPHSILFYRDTQHSVYRVWFHCSCLSSTDNFLRLGKRPG